MGTSLVQKVDTVSASSSALAVTIALPHPGNTLIVAAGNASGNITSITGGGVPATGPYAWAVAKQAGVTDAVAEWIGYVTETPSTSITINLPAGRICAKTMEWSGHLTVDQSHSASATGVTIDPGAITPGQGETLTIAVGVVFQTISAGPTGGFTDLTTVVSGSFSVGVGYLVGGSPPASTDTTWTTTSSGWDAAIVSYGVERPGSYRPLITRWSGPRRMRQLRFRQQHWATDVTAAAATNAPAELTTGTGTALNPAASLAPNSQLTTGTGTSQAPTPKVSPSAQLPTGTGAALAPAASLGPTGGLATGTGTSQIPAASVKPTGGLGSGTGTAQAPAASVSGTSGLATGTGAIGVPAAAIKANAGLATGTGTAYDATVSTGGSATNAPAQLATGTGAAYAAAASLGAAAGLASGTGTAQAPATKVAAGPQVASGTGTAYNATVTATQAGSASPSVASGTGTAWDARVSISVRAGAASGIGTAYNMPRTGGITWATGRATQGVPLAVASDLIGATGARADIPHGDAKQLVPTGRADQERP